MTRKAWRDVCRWALAVIAALFGAAVLAFCAPQTAHAQPLPPGAVRYGPELVAQQRAADPGMYQPWYLGALVEHESCITLKHSRCWNPASRLKTPREEGAGLGQITRAWYPDGRLRFDALAEVRRLDSGLSGWSWSNVYSRPDMQLRAIVVMVRQCRQQLAAVGAPAAIEAMCDAAYNGGISGLQRERRACGMKDGCDPDQWAGHVERVCLKSRAALYGRRSACDINRHHVKDVLQRKPRYQTLWESV